MIDRRQAGTAISPARAARRAALRLGAVAAIAALGSALIGATTPGMPTADMVRAVLRPAVLPAALARLEDARDAGDAAAALVAFEGVVAALPSWADGHVMLAWIRALEVGGQAPEATSRLAFLIDAVDRLEAAAETFAAARPTTAAEVLMSAAILIEVRGDQDPELAAAWRSSLTSTPLDRARELVARAAELVEDPAVASRLAFVTRRSVAAVIQSGDLARAEAVRRAALTRLRELDPTEERAAAIAALETLGDVTEYATGQRRLESLDDEPWLDDVVRALRERGVR